MRSNQPFWQLLRFSLGADANFPCSLSPQEWMEIFAEAKRQAVVGILYAGIERLAVEQQPPRQLMLQWYAYVRQIRIANQVLNRDAVCLVNWFAQYDFYTVILKGQGLGLLYADPMLRQPGDVDIWVTGGRRKVLDFLKRQGLKSHVMYHHMDLHGVVPSATEVHFMPTFLHSPWHNYRLQRFFSRQLNSRTFESRALAGDAGNINVPSAAFNRVFVLAHLYRHLLTEGVGVRQVVDYYYVLQEKLTEPERTETVKVLRQTGMARFAAAVMYVLQYYLGLPESQLLLPPDQKRGLFLLQELQRSGNFGHYDKQMHRSGHNSKLARLILIMRRNFRFLHDYPAEILCYPIFRIYHFIWRMFV